MREQRLRRHVERRYREDVRKLSTYWPSSYLSLSDLARGARSIQLHSGDTHVFDEDEVSRLLSTVPRYFHGLMKVPITLRYEKRRSEAKYRVLGDVWQKRLVELLLHGDYSYTGLEELTVSEFIELLRRYKSLVFVSVTL